MFPCGQTVRITLFAHTGPRDPRDGSIAISIASLDARAVAGSVASDGRRGRRRARRWTSEDERGDDMFTVRARDRARRDAIIIIINIITTTTDDDARAR